MSRPSPSSQTLFFLILPPPPWAPLFPYTTLFRSRRGTLRGKPREPRIAVQLDGNLDRPEEIEVTVELNGRSEEHTSELQSPYDIVCRPLLEKKKTLLSYCSFAPIAI